MTLDVGRGRHRKYRQWTFIELGAVMAATVLNSPRAIELSVYVVRAFVELRAINLGQGDSRIGRQAFIEQGRIMCTENKDTAALRSQFATLKPDGQAGRTFPSSVAAGVQATRQDSLRELSPAQRIEVFLEHNKLMNELLESGRAIPSPGVPRVSRSR